ncbi:Peptidase S24/S26A/S26B, conserved region (plasmid) [Gemmatirosa kalamazoonensis]|uniref:Peptidase S24/S26A/S26B, conserved region n=1 Tax=Gemmatirosa kalamazoonensis TaxID=861299 RepID=W0RR90_9BACT|nr:S24 family peptidase [Gemmatirosa kalamazoonensis]AHG93509.1 Peptidase S24/S26A/S26B, conserved region [Gemmatirosa kalamazoonensis]
MSDDAHPDVPMPASDPTDAAHDAWLDELAAGAHDDALVRLAAAAVAGEEAAAWDDPAFVEWWISRERSAAARATRRMSDAEFLAAGRALQALALARSVGVRWRGARPVLAVRDDELPTAPLVDLAVAAGVGRELWDEPVDAWVAHEEPRGEQHLALRIAGDSMEPLMHTGDTVLVALGRPLRAGTVIVARHPDDGYVCKRVKRVRARAVELESLAPGRPLISIPRDPGLVVGQVVAVWCHHCR